MLHHVYLKSKAKLKLRKLIVTSRRIDSVGSRMRCACLAPSCGGRTSWRDFSARVRRCSSSSMLVIVCMTGVERDLRSSSTSDEYPRWRGGGRGAIWGAEYERSRQTHRANANNIDVGWMFHSTEHLVESQSTTHKFYHCTNVPGFFLKILFATTVWVVEKRASGSREFCSLGRRLRLDGPIAGWDFWGGAVSPSLPGNGCGGAL